MLAKQLNHSELLAEIAAISGTSAEGLPPRIDAEFLRRLTQKQLHDLAKRLAVSGYSRLNKEALATRIWAEVELSLNGGEGSGTREKGQNVPSLQDSRDSTKTDADSKPSRHERETGADENGALPPSVTPGSSAYPSYPSVPSPNGGAAGAAAGAGSTSRPASTGGDGPGLPPSPALAQVIGHGSDGNGAPPSRTTAPPAAGAQVYFYAHAGSVPPAVEPGERVPGRALPVTRRFEPNHHPEAASPQPVESPREIPWGYARDRVTAMPVDPERLYVYWEVIEESIARVRRQLDQAGEHGSDAWLNLRLYDTTGRIFDGSNAHSVIDQGLDRNARQWFFDIGRPTSELIAEIGLLSRQGTFVKIARSGRIEFPRREAVAWSEPEWMTVRVSTGHVERANARSQMKSTGSTVSSGGHQPVGLEPMINWLPRPIEWQDVGRFALGSPEHRVEWEEVENAGTIAFHRRISWESPTMITSWESGPLTYPVEVPLPVRESFVGKTRVFKVGEKTHVVYGPWQVIIRGLGAHHSRTILSRWEVFRAWQTVSEREVREFMIVEAGARPGAFTGSGASERLLRGASELAYAGGSALRMMGGSEVYFLGASERRLGGSSELLFAAASEYMFMGASERRFSGSSELRLAGSSEFRLGLGLGSEGRFMAGGAGSEGRLGAPAGPPLPVPGVYPTPPGSASASSAPSSSSSSSSSPSQSSRNG